MLRQGRISSTGDRQGIDFAGRGTTASSDRIIHCNPCVGLPPLLTESPLLYFGTQAVVGLISLLTLLLLDVLR